MTHSRSVNYPVWASEIERAEETLESLLRALMDATEGYLRAAKYAAPLMLNVETHGLPALRTDGRLI